MRSVFHSFTYSFIHSPIPSQADVRSHSIELLTTMRQYVICAVYKYTFIHSFIHSSRQFSLWISCCTISLIYMVIFSLPKCQFTARQRACFLTHRFGFFKKYLLLFTIHSFNLFIRSFVRTLALSFRLVVCLYINDGGFIVLVGITRLRIS